VRKAKKEIGQGKGRQQPIGLETKHAALKLDIYRQEDEKCGTIGARVEHLSLNGHCPAESNQAGVANHQGEAPKRNCVLCSVKPLKEGWEGGPVTIR